MNNTYSPTVGAIRYSFGHTQWLDCTSDDINLLSANIAQ